MKRFFLNILIFTILLCVVFKVMALNKKEKYNVRFKLNESVVKNLGWLRLNRIYIQQSSLPVVIETEKSTSLEIAQSVTKAFLKDKHVSGEYAVRYIKRMENNILIKTPGVYQVYYRAYFPAVGNWNHNEQMDGGALDCITDSNHGVAKKWIWIKGPEYKLSAGKHIYLFPSPTAWCGGAALDKIVLSLKSSEPPKGKGPDISAIQPVIKGECISNSFTIEDFSAWQLEYKEEKRGGKIKMEYSYDSGNTWKRLLPKELMKISSENKNLTFRITFIAAKDGTSPLIKDLFLSVYTGLNGE